MENAKQFSVGEGTGGKDSEKKQLFPINQGDENSWHRMLAMCQAPFSALCMYKLLILKTKGTISISILLMKKQA